MPPFEETRRDQVEQQQFGSPQPPAGSDSLRQEAFQRPEGQAFRHESVNSIYSANFDNPVSHLDNARMSLRRGDFQSAEREYFAAIRAADRIDQREVARERERVKQALQSESDPAKRRELVQWDSTLHDMQRAPGFTRANLGLCYIRMGYHGEGHYLLMEAGKRDPEMYNDPNFIRRLKALGRPMPGREGGVPGGYDQGRQPVPTDQGRQPGRRPGDTSVQRPPDGSTTRPADRVQPPSGTSRHDAQNFDNPFSHVAKANEDFAKNGKLSPQSKAEYEAAIKAADSIDRQYLAQQMKTLQDALAKAYPPETQRLVAAKEKERDDMLAALPQDKKDKLKELGTKLSYAKTPEEQEQVKKQMRELVPDLAKKQDEIDQLTAQPKAILEQLQALQHLNNSSALARFAYAEALRQSGDKTSAKQLLEQVAKLDPNATKDAKFQEAAKDVGLTLKPTDASTPPAEKPPESGTEQPTTPGASGATEEDAFDLLQKAHELNEKQGFAAAKPAFERAVAAADKIDMKMVDDNIKKIEEALKTETDPEKQKKLQELGALFINYKHAPFITRFQMGIAQNNAGDYAGAKATFDAAAAKDPQAAQEAVFKAALDANSKQQQIKEDDLKKVASTTPTDASRGGAVATADNPYTYIQAAAQQAEAGNNKTAEEQWKKAIEAADKLPMDQYRAKLAEIETQLKSESDPVKSQELLKLKEGLKEVVNLPATVRTETALFYLKNAKPDEAKAMLEQALQKDPTLKDNEKFKQLVQISQENSKGTIDKALSFLKSTGKELVSDGISGGVGLAAFSLTPGGRVLKLGSALLAGGATKHGLSMAGLGGEGKSFSQNMVWGGVDALAMVSGAGVRQRMMTGFEKNLGTAALKDMAIKGGITEAERLALLEGGGAGGLRVLTGMLEKNSARLSGTTLKEIAIKAGITDAEKLAALEASSGAGGVAELSKLLKTSGTALNGTTLREMAMQAGITDAKQLAAFESKKGLDGLKAVTAMLTENTELKKKAASDALKEAIAAAPWYKKPALWMQGHSPLLWRIPNQSLKTFAEKEREYLAAKGSRWNYMNPLNMFADPGNYSTLRNLEARTFWNRYKIDAASVGATSLVYRGTHEGARIGEVDPVTGKKYSAYDAVTSTALATAGDAVSGGFLIAGFRGMGGFFTKHSGVAGEVKPLTRPTPLTAESSIYSKVAQPFRYGKYGFDWTAKKIGDGGTAFTNFLSQEGRLQTGLSAFPTTAALFSPRLYEAYGAWEKTSEYEKILAEIQKPLEDKAPTQPLPTDKPATPPAGGSDGGASKPADQPAAPQPGSEKDGVGEGLPE